MTMDQYQNSVDWLSRAEKVIPLGSQTFSKSKYSVPLGAAPLYAASAEGCVITDIDGNSYIDLVSGLLSISLGYQDADVDVAVLNQMRLGVTMSLPTRLEALVAEKLVQLIPCAEQVRFGKNGSDVTSAAVRMARAYTDREHVLVCGYHGWQDWYIGSTTRDAGVPESVKALTHSFAFNDLDSLEALFDQFSGQVAAVMMEPMSSQFPSPGFLEGVRELCSARGALLIFDEMITGFRFHEGGAQAFFDVTPDLATFGKGMANGYPLSAVVGRSEIMAMMDTIFFSGTFGGEALSLAAASAVLDKIVKLSVPAILARRGQALADAVTELAERHGVDSWFRLVGHPSWKIMDIGLAPGADTLLLKSLLIQELAERGVLTMGSHNISLAHDEDAIAQIVKAYDHVFSKIAQSLRAGNTESLLKGELIKPVFKVR